MMTSFKIVKYYLLNVSIWIVAYFVLNFLQFENNTIQYSEIITYSIWGGIFSGITWGLLFQISIYFRNRISNYLSRVLFTISTIFLSTVILVLLLYILSKFIDLQNIPKTIKQLPKFYESRNFSVLLTHSFIIALLYHFVYEMDRKLGKGVLLKFLLGHYYTPKEIKQVFLFIDLKSSSYYAEQLGHFKYSKLVQDCFNDLSNPIAKNNARIHQFVGDEVVLTWRIDKKLDPNNCIQCYIDFVDLLKSKEEYYLKNYNLLPVFKGGIHSGKVMVAQVGQHKSEIAYHGDAINTASRIQGMCNELKSNLLISRSFVEFVKSRGKSKFKFNSMGQFILKGKLELVELFMLTGNRKKI